VTAALGPIVQGLLLAALLLLPGSAVAGQLVSRHEARLDADGLRVVQGWLGRLPGLFAWFLLMLAVVRGAVQVLGFAFPGEPLPPDLVRSILLEGIWGGGWVTLVVASFLALVFSWRLREHPPIQRSAVVLLSVAALWGQTGMGHATDEVWTLPIGRLVHFGHLVGGALWLGTLSVLALAVFPALAHPERHGVLAEVVAGFSVPARLGAAMLLASGTISTWTYTGGAPSALWGAPWGRLLLLKLALLAGVAAFGWVNWKRVTPQLLAGNLAAPDALRRAVHRELLLGAALLAVTAILVGTGFD
jgi:putative copper export protein